MNEARKHDAAVWREPHLLSVGAMTPPPRTINIGDYVRFVWGDYIEVGAANLAIVRAMAGEVCGYMPGGCPPSRWVDVLARQA